MSISERERHELHTSLAEAIGPEPAATLMSYLPPVGWADVATKRDLDALEERIDLRFHALEQRMDLRFESLGDRFATKDDVHRETRVIVTWVLTVFVACAGLALTLMLAR
jgi:hypothetical protein